MKSINYIFKSVTLVFVVLIIHSCTKDEPKINFTKELESRTKSQIGDKSIQWLDNFRLDLLENRVSEYSIEDAINGLDILLNLSLLTDLN